MEDLTDKFQHPNGQVIRQTLHSTMKLHAQFGFGRTSIMKVVAVCCLFLEGDTVYGRYWTCPRIKQKTPRAIARFHFFFLLSTNRTRAFTI